MAAALCDRLSFRRFVGLGLADEAPHYATISRFRQQLTARGLAVALFAEVSRPGGQGRHVAGRDVGAGPGAPAHGDGPAGGQEPRPTRTPPGPAGGARRTLATSCISGWMPARG